MKRITVLLLSISIPILLSVLLISLAASAAALLETPPAPALEAVFQPPATESPAAPEVQPSPSAALKEIAAEQTAMVEPNREAQLRAMSAARQQQVNREASQTVASQSPARTVRYSPPQYAQQARPASLPEVAPAPARQKAITLPAAPEDTFTTTLQTVHRSLGAPEAGSSTFVFTNTGGVTSTTILNFYWPNGEFLQSHGPYTLSPGQVINFAMDDPWLFMGEFVGRVDIVSDQPVVGQVTSPPYGVISGWVMDSDGVTPFSSGNIEAHPYNQNWWKGGAILSNGQFFIGGLPDASYIVMVRTNYPYATQWYNGADRSQNATPVNIGGATSVSDINFTIQPGGQISGTVYAADGVTPLANVNVDLDQGWFGACTDANGHFTISGMGYAPQVVRAGGGWSWCTNASSPYVTEYYQEAVTFDQATALNVGPGTDTWGNINFTLDVGAVITGYVRAAAGGLPLENVHVAASIYDNEWYWGHANTDASGYYLISGLPAGDYRVRVDDGNQLPGGYAYQYYDHVFDYGMAARVPVATGVTVGGINFDLVPGGTITGTVLDQNTGLPVANVNVGTDHVIGSGGVGTCTDSNGRYTISNVMYGDNRIYAGGDWNWCLNVPSNYMREYYLEAANWDQATLLNLNAGQDLITGIDFTLEPGGFISGYVTANDTGLPMSNVHVHADDFNNGPANSGANTDANGYYLIGGLSAGDYRVRVDANSLPAGYAFQYYSGAIEWQQAWSVPVSVGATTPNINFDVQPGGVITGVVVDQDTGLPLANINLNASMVNYNDGFGACTDSNGVYAFHGAPFTDYKVEAGGNWNHCQQQPGVYGREYYQEQTSWDSANQVQINPGVPTASNINFTLQLGGFITGTVVEDGGGPLGNLRVAAVVPRPDRCDGCYDWMESNDTAADGTFTIGPLTPGNYAVFACANCTGGHLLVNEFYNDVYDVGSATLVNVPAGGTHGGIHISMGTGILLTGKVSVPPGYSAQGIQIDVWNTDGMPYGSGGATDASGNYAIPVPPWLSSHWGVAARPWGTNLGAQWVHQFAMDDGTNWDFDLQVGNTITGQITDNGVPVANIWINADNSRMGQGDNTDVNGFYEITNLPDGDYIVRVENWGSPYAMNFYGGTEWSLANPVRVGGGQTRTGINIEADLAGRIEGFVYEQDGVTPVEGVRVRALRPDGIWYGYSQPNGYYTIDLPEGDYRLLFDREGGWDLAPLYYPGVPKHRDAALISVAPMASGTTTVNFNVQRMGAIEGQVTNALTGAPQGGVMVVADMRDPAADFNWAFMTCSDEFGNYRVDLVFPGEITVTAMGLCGAYEYTGYTTTLIMPSGGLQTLNLNLTPGVRPETPFTIRTNESWGYTPLSSGGSFFPNDTDQILPALYAPLVQMDDSGHWVADLLTQVPTTANGGAKMVDGRLTVTYTLQSGLLWSDGAPLTSADIRFTWQMRTQVHPALDYYLASVDPAWKIENITTPDPLTAVATYESDQVPPDYLAALTYLLPEHVLAGQAPADVMYTSSFALHPVGNGPYVVEDGLPGGYLTLRANPNYHKRSLGLPAIPSMRFLFADHPFYSLLSGAAQASIGISGAVPPDYQTFDLNYSTRQPTMFGAIMPNNKLPFFADAQVRKALSHALNRQSIAATAFGHFFDGTFNWLPEDHAMAGTAITAYDYNLATAASLLDAAGWIDHNGNGTRDKDGVELSFELAIRDGSAIRLDTVTIFQADLASIGVDAQIVSYPMQDHNYKARHNQLDAYIMFWYFDSRYDPMGKVLFHSESLPSAYTSFQGSWFSGQWQDPVNDALLEAASSELDDATLRSLYDQQQTLWTAQSPIWPFVNVQELDAAVPTLLNFRPTGVTPVTWNIEHWQVPANPYDLGVRKALAPNSPAPQPGVDISYVIDVRNSGYFTMTGATLLDTLPAGVQFVSAVPAPSAVNGSLLTWNLGSLPGNSAPQQVRVTVHIPDSMAHGTQLHNTVQVYADQTDSRPANNQFTHQVEVRDDVDLAVTKTGVGQAAVGEQYAYYLNYANWGGAPAASPVITDVLPPEVTFISAVPAPSTVSGGQLTWNLASLPGNQWGGQIQVNTEIAAAGRVTNTAEIAYNGGEPDLANNTGQAVETVDDILAPVILRPTQGTTGPTPTVSGLAPSGSVVAIYDLDAVLMAEKLQIPFYKPQAALLITTTASLSGTFSIELNLTPGSYVLAAKATKGGLTSNYSNAVPITVDAGLPLDPDLVTITASGVDFSAGVVRAERRTLAHRILGVQAQVPCGDEPTGYLDVTENGTMHYNIPAQVTSLGGGLWELAADVWLSEPHSTYDLWLVWDCGGFELRELLLYILIDPDGYLYDATQVASGSAITDSLLFNGVITAYVKTNDTWNVWPASYYGQTNPQSTDSSVEDGVLVPGYYSFLTPPGVYRITASAPGYQPYESPVLTVITAPIHLDIGLLPVMGGAGFSEAPAALNTSSKAVDRAGAWVGETLKYDLWLENTGDAATGLLSLSDAIPQGGSYLPGSLNWDLGDAAYNPTANAIEWQGSLPGHSILHVTYNVQVDATPGSPFTMTNQTVVDGPANNLVGLPDLTVTTRILNQVGVEMTGASGQLANPGQVVHYTQQITNTGNATDTFTLDGFSSHGWMLDLPDPLTLAAGQSTSLDFTVQVPAAAPAFQMDTVTITATSQLNTTFTASASQQTTVRQVAGVALSSAAAATGNPGRTVTFTHTLTNQGNGSDTFTLQAVSARGWTVTLSPNPTLGAGASQQVTVSVQIPAGTADGVSDTITFTAASTLTPAVSSQQTDALTVDWYNLFMPAIRKNR